MADARRWVNGSGQTRWQPVVNDGRVRWYERDIGPLWSVHESNLRSPSLYRSRRWARFLARRRERHEARTTWQPAEGDTP